MCIIFPLDTKTYLPFRKFSTSSELPQNPNVLDMNFPCTKSLPNVIMILHGQNGYSRCCFIVMFAIIIIIIKYFDRIETSVLSKVFII